MQCVCCLNLRRGSHRDEVWGLRRSSHRDEVWGLRRGSHRDEVWGHRRGSHRDEVWGPSCATSVEPEATGPVLRHALPRRHELSRRHSLPGRHSLPRRHVLPRRYSLPRHYALPWRQHPEAPRCYQNTGSQMDWKSWKLNETIVSRTLTKPRPLRTQNFKERT